MKTKNDRRYHTLITMVLAIATAITTTPIITHAEDAETSIKNTAIDAKTNTKKEFRKVKRTVRKAVGNDTAGKDIKDKANDIGDDLKGAKQKAKNKVNE